MIIVKVQGGLANQLFEFALYKMFEHSGYEVYLDDSFYSTQSLRKFELSNFPNIKYKLYDKTDNILIEQIGDDFHYKDFSSLRDDKNYLFNGYWQSEKYFTHIQDIIRKELSPNPSLIFDLLEDYNLDILNDAVSLHVRRGDYVNQPQNHPLQDISYYEKALDILKGKYKNILVFSDDIKWCEENLKFDSMIFVSNNKNIDDIYLQSMCKHNIICNSSFSWWGAWLNTNPEKIVIAPNKWFGSSLNLNTSDIIPKEWIKL